MVMVYVLWVWQWNGSIIRLFVTYCSLVVWLLLSYMAATHPSDHSDCVLSHSTVSNSLRPQGLWPARLCPWNFPRKNTGVGYHFLLQGIFPTQGLNPGPLRCLPWQVGSLPLSHLGIPLIHQVHLKSPQERFLHPPDQWATSVPCTPIWAWHTVRAHWILDRLAFQPHITQPYYLIAFFLHLNQKGKSQFYCIIIVLAITVFFQHVGLW